MSTLTARLRSYIVASGVLAAAACGTTAGDEQSMPAGETRGGSDEVSALYAGSLASVMEDYVGPDFTAATGHELAGEAHGSLGAAQLIRDGLRTPDVFVSADPVVNEEVLMGEQNDDLVDWYITFASSQLVIGYSPDSPHVREFEAVADGDRKWFEVLAQPDVSFGRGDPTIDPKGYRTLFMFDLAAVHHEDDSIYDLIDDPVHSEQVLPEVSLLARVDSGQFDAGVFYRHEAVAAGLPHVSLPPEIDLGDPALADFYDSATYDLPDGSTVTGAPILFTIGIPSTVNSEEAAEEFVRFLLTSDDQIEDLGFTAIDPLVEGEETAVPSSIADLL